MHGNIAPLGKGKNDMKRRVFTVKVRKHRGRIYLQTTGKSDRGQNSLIAHGSAPYEKDGKKTAVKLLAEVLALSEDPTLGTTGI